MKYVKWTIWAVLLLCIVGFLFYTLPRHNVVRIVQTEVRLVEIPSNALFWAHAERNASRIDARDVKFVDTVNQKNNARVFRNEDTGWGWPPYFKFNSSDVQARAANLISTETDKQWVLIRHYGVRSNLLSIYPNVLSIRAVDSPDVMVIPWLTIIVLVLLLALLITLRRLWKRFWENRVDPVVAEVAKNFDEAEDLAGEAATKFRGKRQRFREWWVELFG